MCDQNHIREALRRAEKTVTLRPERGQRVYRNSAQVRHGTRCEVTEGAERMSVDVPRALGGAGDTPSPSTILRAAFTSCVAIGVKQWAARHDVPIEAVDVTLETDIDARGQLGVADQITPGFLGIRLEIDVASPAPGAEVEEIIAKSLRYSPLVDVFANPQLISQKIRVRSPDGIEQET